MQSTDALVRQTEERLARAGCVAYGEEAAELLEAASTSEVLSQWLSRRERGEPLPWILGHLSFGGVGVQQDGGVYVPRAQSLVLVRRALELLPAVPSVVADICCGTGALGAYIQHFRKDCVVLGADIDQRAVRCATKNLRFVVCCDLTSAIGSASVDLLCSVTPYVPDSELRLLPRDTLAFEPHRALVGGRDGLSVLRRLVDDGARVLRSGGWFVSEIGGDQEAEVRSILSGRGFSDIAMLFDEEGDLRGVEARLCG